jgi:hypothetical protein
MMHIAYPNIDPDTSPPVFRACVRYVSQVDAPGDPYKPSRPNTPNGAAIREGVRRLVPAWSDATLAVELYEKADTPGTYRWAIAGSRLFSGLDPLRPSPRTRWAKGRGGCVVYGGD